MESQRPKNESRKGKTFKNLEVQSNDGSLSELKSHKNVHSFLNNGIIEDDNTSDTDSCYSLYNMKSKLIYDDSNSNSDSGATSNSTWTRHCDDENGSRYGENEDRTLCKPCLVILERLSDEVVQNLLSKNNFEAKNAKKSDQRNRNSRSTRFHHVLTEDNRRSRRFQKTTISPDSKNRDNCNEIESSSSSDKTIKSDCESNGSCLNENINIPRLTSDEDKANSDNSNTNEAFSKEPCATTSQIEHLDKHESSVITTENLESKLSLPKRFRLSRKKKKISNNKEDGNCKQDTRPEILQGDNLKELKDTGINSEPLKDTVSSQRRLRRTPRENYATTKEPESLRRNLRKKSLRGGDPSEIEGSKISSDNYEPIPSPQKRFHLSLRLKNTTSKVNQVSAQNPSSTTPQLQHYDEIIESNKSDPKYPKHLIKRKIVDTEDAESPAPKINKFDERQDATDSDASKVDKLDPLHDESSASRNPNQQDTLQDPQVPGNRSGRLRVSSRIQNSVPIVKNIRVSLEKMKNIAIPSTSKQIDDVKLTSDRCIDTYEPDTVIQENILDTKGEAPGKSPNKTRNTKITDYFFKIDKRSVIAENIKKNCDQRDNDLILKRKFGISKEVSVSLSDLKKLKISGSEYSASNIEKLTREYPNSSIDNNVTIITVNRYQTALPSNNFLCSSNELLTNDEQSSNDFANISTSHDHIDEPSHDTLQIQTVKITTDLSPKNHKFPQVKNLSPTKSLNDQINVEQSFTDLPNLFSVSDSSHSLQPHMTSIVKNSPVKDCKSPRVKKNSSTRISNDLSNSLPIRDKVDEISRDSLDPHTVSIAKNLSITCLKSPQVKKHSSAKNTHDPLNDNSFTNSGPRLRSRKEKESLDSTKRLKDVSPAINNINFDQELPGQDSDCQKSFKVITRKHSLDSRTNTTPTSSQTFSPLTWKVDLSPQRRTVLINDAKKSNVSQMQTTDMTLSPLTQKVVLSPRKPTVLMSDETESNVSQIQKNEMSSKSPKTNKVQEESDAVPRTNNLEESREDNELQKKPNDELVQDKDSNVVVIHQTKRHPVLESLIQSPIIVGPPRNHVKHQTPRRLPVNSMTILTREMIEENYFWIGLDNTIGDVNETTTTAAAKEDTMKKNEASENIPFENTATDSNEKSSTTAKNVENNYSGNSNPVDIVANEEDAKLRPESQDNNAFLVKLLTSESAETLPPRCSPSTNIESCLNQENALTVSRMVQKKLTDVQCSDTVSEKVMLTVRIPRLRPILPKGTENSNRPITVECNDKGAGKSNTPDEFAANLEQDGQLIKRTRTRTNRNESDPRPVEDVMPGTSSPSVSNCETVLPEKTAKNTNKSMIDCVICRKTYRNTRGLEQHLRVHIRHTDESCIICDKPITKENAAEHYLEHCGWYEDVQKNFFECGRCHMKYTKRSSLTNHMKKHDMGKNRSKGKLTLTNMNHNKCDVCQLTCDTEEELHSHVFKHTEQELQDAFKAAMEKKIQGQSGSATISQNQSKDVPEIEKTQDKEQLSSEVPEATNTSPKSPPAIPNVGLSICMCHKDERLEISGGVIIEIALACVQCKTLFKSRKCFKDHYNNTSCKWGDDAPAEPKMFCNKCCVILNNLEEMHSHLAKHGEDNVDMKTSLLCKHCNIFFFSIGSLFYAHWTNHRNNPLFTADHQSFSKNMKVKIVEPGAPGFVHEDEPTECLFISDHQCKNCDKPFQTESDLKKHLNSPKSCTGEIVSAPKVIENPKSGYNLICSICNKEFVDKSTFDIHIEEHDTIKGFLQRPQELDESLGKNSLTCSICKTEYDTISNYREHLIRHKVIQEKFVCNYCNLMMDSVEDFERHFAEHKGTPEKPVACKVIFATAKFHCKPCKIWFDSQHTLDEHVTAHLATHNTLRKSRSKSLENSATTITPANEKKSHVCATCQKEFDDQVKLDAHVSTHENDSSEKPITDPVVIHLSDDSNSADIEIIGIATSEESEESVVENTLTQEQQETVTIQETKKQPFLRVKNLKELLPYACTKCKAEFDTQENLNKHVCTRHVKPTQDKGFSYSCTICKTYKCDNGSDWNLHVLSHFPLHSSQKFSEVWYHAVKLQSGQHIFKCNICQNFDAVTIHLMRQHFQIHHRDIYHPIFKCRVCRTFKTEMEQEIRRHEAAHFIHPSPLRQLAVLGNQLSTAQPIELSNYLQQPLSIPPLINSASNTSTNKSDNSNNSQQLDNPNNLSRPGINPSVIRSAHNLPSLQSLPIFTNSQQQGSTLQPDNNSKNFQQSVSNLPATSSGNNLSSLRPKQSVNNFMQLGSTRKQDNNSNNFQQAILIPNTTTTTSLGNSFPTIQLVDRCNKQFQRPVAFPVLTNLSQPPQNLDNSQQREPTRQSNNNSNDFQQPNSMAPVTNSSNKLPTPQPADSPNNLRHTLWMPPVSSSSNNLPSLQPSQISNNQPVSTLPPNGNCNSFQQSISIPSVTISGNNLSSIQQVDISNKFQQSVSTPAVTSSGNNLPALQPLQSFNNSQQPSSTHQPCNNSNNFQQSMSLPPSTSSSSSISSIQSMDNSQWSTATAQTFQIQINNGTPFNNMTNVMHTVPMYVASLTYCCRICKTFKCSSEQELKVHESLHDQFIQLTEPSKRLFRCKVCTNIFCPTEEHLKLHMELYHKADKSNVSQNQTQSNITDNQFKCKHCPQTFASSSQLTRHTYTSHPFLDQQINDTQFQRTYPYMCELCTIGFFSDACLQAHVRHIHSSVKLTRSKVADANTLYQCDTCGLLLISEATLNYHMKSHNIGSQ